MNKHLYLCHLLVLSSPILFCLILLKTATPCNKLWTKLFIHFSFYYRYFYCTYRKDQHTGKITHSVTHPRMHASFCVLISMFSSRRPNFSEAAHTTQKVDTASCNLHWFDAMKFHLLSSVFLLNGTANLYLPEMGLSSVNIIREWKYSRFICSHFTIHSHNTAKTKMSMYCLFPQHTQPV